MQKYLLTSTKVQILNQLRQANLREDALDRNPGPLTRVTAVARYPGDELDYDVAGGYPST